MPVSRKTRDADRKPAAAQAALGELDRVKLTWAVSVKDRAFAPGLVGTVVYCHGATTYEVEFPGIDDIFQIPADHLEKRVS
jgi:hypothetical protein